MEVLIFKNKVKIRMVIVSCIRKFHAFNLAEELNKQQMLEQLFTSYAYQKNSFGRLFTKRKDKEKIPTSKISTILPLAMALKISKQHFKWNGVFDKWVAQQIPKIKNADTFIGWSGMSHNSILKARECGLKTIVERGSTHIEFQIGMLEEEFKKFDLTFPRDQRVIDKELLEYEAADYISVPSQFVAQTFLDKGFSSKKLLINNYGSSSFFKPIEKSGSEKSKFRILYLGTTSIQKGVKYLFDAMDLLPEESYELWLVGSITEPLKKHMKARQKSNWKVKGFVNHYELAAVIGQCDVAVQPSLQEGLSMVIPQMLSCGLPVIASTNSGGEDLIENGKNGFIVPIRNAEIIAEKIQFYQRNPNHLIALRKNVLTLQSPNRTWEEYGKDYVSNLKNLK